ncbi:MAG: metallophosphoesterase [Clostridia bacterium]|nr:metallophosphoesterase [Clostridia bacterium]
MKIFAIGDLHLSTTVQKPMDIFGPGWENHFERIKQDWLKKVTPDDLVLIPGDISWGMYVEEAKPDIDIVSSLPGKIIFTRGNHDYWWKSITAVRSILSEDRYALQNDAIRFDGVVICGTRGWTVPEKTGVFKSSEDETIYKRELIRLELALQDLTKKRQDGDVAIVMLHYPPFNAKMYPSDFTRLCEKYKVDYVVYGHLHGKNCRCKLELIQNNIKYLLTSCDQVNCELVSVCEIKSN